MSKYDELTKLLMEGIRASKPTVGTLRVVIGELQRGRTTPNDEDCFRVIKKMIQNNEETYNLRKDENLMVENTMLKSLLPTEMNTLEMSNLLVHVLPQIREAKSEGMAIGIAMKILKATGKGVNSGMVASIVKSLRL